MPSDILCDIFDQTHSEVIRWEGLTVRSLIRMAPPFDSLLLHFDERKRNPVQGLRIRATGGALSVNGVESSDVLLWMDSAPQDVTLHVGDAPEIRLWNVWRGRIGATQAWLGNAGILLEKSTNGDLTLRCSDGHGEVDFGDLVLSVRRHPQQSVTTCDAPGLASSHVTNHEEVAR